MSDGSERKDKVRHEELPPMGMLPKIFEILEGDGRDVVDLKQRMHAVEKGLR